MSEIAEAKRRLPLPVMMNQLGDGEHAKRRALCPFHEDHRESFSVFQTEHGWRFKCHAGCGVGDEITYLEKRQKIPNRDATKLYLTLVGANGYAGRVPNTSTAKRSNSAAGTFSWQACVEAFTQEHLERLAESRAYSVPFCSWLYQHSLIGLNRDCFAFPVHYRGEVVAAHCRAEPGTERPDWFFFPKLSEIGLTIQPLVIGDLAMAKVVHVFESQWDTFAVADKLALYEQESVALLATRGASNGRLVAGLIPGNATVFAWKQNDRAGDDWLKAIATHAGASVQVVTTPPRIKDVNDWTKGGATADELESALDRAEVVNPKIEPRPLAALLDSICAFLQRYIVFQHPGQPVAIALWVAHAWALDAFEYTPYLHVASPEKQCGKTRLLDCLELLIPKPWRAILPSEQVLFRNIEKNRPTLLLDELDAIFTNAKDDRKEALRALLNAGFEQKASIPRCVPPKWEVRNFAVFCPKALAGIGHLPDTVRDRSVPIQLVRRSRDERIERFRKREAEKVVFLIRAELDAWAHCADNIVTLRDSRPVPPDALSDRQADICEPLLAIAELAGGEWPGKAQSALIKLCCRSEEDESIGVKLLIDMRTVFNEAGTDRLSTKEILEALVRLETDAPWAEWWEQDLKNQNTKSAGGKLGRKLKPYAIKAKVMRLPGEPQARGYMRQDFEEVWDRFCPAVPPQNVTT